MRAACERVILIRALIKPCQERQALTSTRLLTPTGNRRANHRAFNAGFKRPVTPSRTYLFSFLPFPRSADPVALEVRCSPLITLAPFYSLRHLYSLRPSVDCYKEMPPRPCGADTEEAITARRGQIGRGSYLGRIMFDILHHYQLPPPPQESYLSLADVPLSVMNFLYPPPRPLLPPSTSGPLNPSSSAPGGGKKRRVSR